MSPIGWASLLPKLDRDSIVPLYRQIYERLREAILAGTLPESTRLPPERTMAERLAVNRSTIVHAYRELVGDGLIEQRVGSGSRVVPRVRGGQPERAAGVPWWVTLPPWRVGAFPAVDLRIDIQVLSAVSARVLDGSATLGVTSPAGILPGLQRQALAAIRMLPVVSSPRFAPTHGTARLGRGRCRYGP